MGGLIVMVENTASFIGFVIVLSLHFVRLTKPGTHGLTFARYRTLSGVPP
jgi:hypothetical protein